MANKESLFASLHILMRAIHDGPEDAGRRLHRYWYRESRCQVRTGWQKPLWLHSFAKSAQSASKFSPRLCVFCAFLWLKNPFNQRNPWLTNDLRTCKALYNGRDISTSIEDSLQIRLFMQNKANFRKSQMNVNKVLTKDYENKSNWAICENKANSNPIQTQSNPIKANFKPKQTQYEPNQSQFQSQYNAALHLFAVGSRKDKIMLFKSLSGKCQLIFTI